MFPIEHEHYTPQAINGTPTDIPTTQGSRFSRLSAPHHEHRHALNREPHKSEHDLGILGIMLHIMGDAANNIGVIIAGAIIWKTHSPARFYADPAVSVGIALMILLSSIPISTAKDQEQPPELSLTHQCSQEKCPHSPGQCSSGRRSRGREIRY